MLNKEATPKSGQQKQMPNLANTMNAKLSVSLMENGVLTWLNPELNFSVAYEIFFILLF